MVAEISFVPIGEGPSLSAHVARAVEVIKASGLAHEFHAMGTNVEGSFEEITALVQRCSDALFAMGAKRLLIRLVLDDRRDRPSTLSGKKKSVEEKLPRG